MSAREKGDKHGIFREMIVEKITKKLFANLIFSRSKCNNCYKVLYFASCKKK